MKKSKTLLLLLLLLVSIVFSTSALENDYFVFDQAKNKLSFMGGDTAQFVETISPDMNPDLIIRTSEPYRYLAMDIPGPDDKGRYKNPGSLVIFNNLTKQVEEKVQLGYGPFRWTITKDRSHFFIGYQLSPKEEDAELIHYDLAVMKMEKTAKFEGHFNTVVLSSDESKLFVLLNGPGGSLSPFQLLKAQNTTGRALVYKYSPLEAQAEILIKGNPLGLYILSNDRIVLVDKISGQSNNAGSIRILDSNDYKIIEEQTISKAAYVRDYWFDSQNTLVVTAEEMKKGRVYKVTDSGIIIYDNIDSNLLYLWVNLYYFKDKESIYILGAKDMKIINCETGVLVESDTKGSIWKGVCNFERLPDSDLATLYNENGGKVRFFDLNQNKLVANLNYGRPGVKVGNFIAGVAMNLVLSVATTAIISGSGYYAVVSRNWFKGGNAIAATPDRSQFYILNRATRDITVFDRDFKQLTYIVPPEAPQTLYQVRGANPLTLVVTGKKIYKINNADSTLTPIYEFSKPVQFRYFFDDGAWLVVSCDKELVFLDPVTLEAKHQFIDSGQEEGEVRLKKGEMQYNFVPAF